MERREVREEPPELEPIWHEVLASMGLVGSVLLVVFLISLFARP
jgi:hypothetical protein